MDKISVKLILDKEMGPLINSKECLPYLLKFTSSVIQLSTVIPSIGGYLCVCSLTTNAGEECRKSRAPVLRHW
jgi:hypothetical protein